MNNRYLDVSTAEKLLEKQFKSCEEGIIDKYTCRLECLCIISLVINQDYHSLLKTRVNNRLNNLEIKNLRKEIENASSNG